MKKNLVIFGVLLLFVGRVAKAVWDTATPAGSEAKSLGDDRIRELKTDIQTSLQFEGDFPGNDTSNPRFIYTPSTGTTANRPTGNDAPMGRLYVNVSSGCIEMNLGSTTTVNWQCIPNAGSLGVINIKDPPYNAKGDGTTNDTAAIDLALASNPIGVIYAPSGTYMTVGSHTITTQNFFGAGKGKTIFKKLSGSAKIFTLTNQAQISDFEIDGNSLGGGALVVNRSSHSIVKNIKFTNVQGSTYALQLGGVCQYNSFQGLDFTNNYGNIYINGGYYSSFYDTNMLGSQSGYGIKIETTSTDIDFYKTYMESNIYMTSTGIRDVRFKGMRVRLDGMNDAWFQGRYSVGSEVAQISLEDASILKTVNISSYPVFDISIYQLYMKNIHVFDSVSSSGWYVITDRGTNNLRLQDVTVESANYWTLFSTGSGGTNTIADAVNYTQGVTGLATWSNSRPVGSASSFAQVSHSNLNHSIAPSGGSGLASGYSFEHIYGNLDLTNTNAPVMLFDISGGTVTDPNNAVWTTKVSSGTDGNSVSIPVTGTYVDVVGVALTTGRWSLNALATYSLSTATISGVSIGISTIPNSGAQIITGDNKSSWNWAPSTFTTVVVSPTIPQYDVIVSSTVSPITYYLEALVTFTGGGPGGNVQGNIRGWRRTSFGNGQ